MVPRPRVRSHFQRMEIREVAARRRRSSVEAGKRGRPAGEERGSEQRGVDVPGVRRDTAPPLRPYARGALEEARSKKLRSDVYAATSRRMRGSIKTLRRLTAEATVDLVPVTIASTKLLAAALKAGSYRSATAYLAIWKQLHVKSWHPWTADQTLPERWEQACAADRARIDVAVVGAMWFLRGGAGFDRVANGSKIQREDHAQGEEGVRAVDDLPTRGRDQSLGISEQNLPEEERSCV